LSTLSDEFRNHLYNNFEYFRKYQYKVKDINELQTIILNLKDLNADLNWIDTSNITNMSSLFE